MKIYAISLIVLSMFGIALGESCPTCDWKADIHCGKDPVSGCAVSAINKCLVEALSCRRELVGAKPFAEIIKGQCPKDLPKCPNLKII